MYVNFRLKLQKAITDQIYDFPVSKDWKLNARPCSPRVLFMFESCTIDTFTDEQETTPGGFRGTRPQVSLFFCICFVIRRLWVQSPSESYQIQ